MDKVTQFKTFKQIRNQFKLKKYLFTFLHYPALTKSYYTLRQLTNKKKAMEEDNEQKKSQNI